MKKVIYNESLPPDMVFLNEIPSHTPIFARNRATGKLVGMLVLDSVGWCICEGGDHVSPYMPTREECLRTASSKYEYVVED